MIKIMAASPGRSDGTSWYRSAGPLARLQQDYDIQVLEYGNNEVEWSDMIHFHVLFLQRPSLKRHLKLMNEAMFLGLKIWIDFDDLLWHVPDSNPVAASYNTEEAQQIMEIILKSAMPQFCTITVSTKALADEVLLVNPGARVVVIPNALDERRLFPKINQLNNKRGLLGWRGSDTHLMDLVRYRIAIEKMIETYDVEFIGHRPQYLLGDYKYVPPRGILRYFAELKWRRWEAFFVCLEDNRFNRCKSNIAALEAFYAGALTVAPEWPEWNIPGLYNYSTGSNFNMALVDAVESCLNMTETRRQAAWKMMYDEVMLKYTLGATNNARACMLQELTGIEVKAEDQQFSSTAVEEYKNFQGVTHETE